MNELLDEVVRVKAKIGFPVDLFHSSLIVPGERLELSWVAPSAPKAGASTNFAIPA